MDTSNGKDSIGKSDYIPVEFLGRVLDNYEAYQIMSEVFYDFIPDSIKKLALSQAANRVYFELKDKYEPK